MLKSILVTSLVTDYYELVVCGKADLLPLRQMIDGMV